MQGNRSTVVIIVVILLALILGVIFYQSSLPPKETVEPRKEAVEKEPVAREPAAVGEEASAGEAQSPEKAELGERVEEEPETPPVRESVALVSPDEPVAAPPPSSKIDCKADPPALARQRKKAAPEGMVYIPGGPFTMGSGPEVGHPDESPAREVCVSGFYIGRTEVTNAEFKKFIEATGYVTEAERDSDSEERPTWRGPYGPESNAESTPDHPVVCVSWNDAMAYATWAGKRLPTEAEWEKAARGTDGRIYPWGNQEPDGTLANVADRSAGLKWSNSSLDDGYMRSAPVGSFPKGTSVFGVADMAGNVWEWCYDWWDANTYKTAPSRNPTGPEGGEFRVIRGGSWFYHAEGARAANRMYFRPSGSSATIGFRCVQDVDKR